MLAIDNLVLNFFLENRFEWISFIMLCITYLGSYTAIFLISLLTALSFKIHKETKYFFGLILSTIISNGLVFGIKYLVERARPDIAIYQEMSPSFPSWHSASAMLLYGFIFLFIWNHEKHPLKNKFLVIIVFIIFSIGLSRLYLGVHYLSDVLVGYFIAIIAIIISKKYFKI